MTKQNKEKPKNNLMAELKNKIAQLEGKVALLQEKNMKFDILIINNVSLNFNVHFASRIYLK